jgi:hypothetical protein
MDGLPRVPPSLLALLTELRTLVFPSDRRVQLSDPTDLEIFYPCCRDPVHSRWLHMRCYGLDGNPITRTAWLDQIEKRSISSILAREARRDELVARSTLATLALSIYLDFEIAVHIAVFAFWIL